MTGTCRGRSKYADRSTLNELNGRIVHLRTQTEALARQKRTALEPLPPRNASRSDLQGRREAATFEDRRAALAEAIAKVTISNPAVKTSGGNTFDTDRINIRWRWDLYVRASDAAWERMTDGEREQAEAEAQEEIEAVLELERAGSSS